MKNRIILICAICVMFSTTIFAQTGIKFFKGSYAEALAIAKKEKKQIFIDFFTEWCGPCLTMAENIFILPEVGEVYNSNFICLKIDAEKGEGIELAKKFEVRSYPSYIFVNPKTGEMSHRSGGNKPKEDFIGDTKGALNPKLSSMYLAEKYKSGNYDKTFLIDYIEQKKASGARDEAAKLFNELVSKFDARLTDKKVWDLFVANVNDWESSYVKEICSDYEKFVSLYGKKAVDDKLMAVSTYASFEFLASMPAFEGKEYNIAMREFSTLERAKKYDEAIAKMDEILNNKSFDQEKVISTLAFTARINPRYDGDDTPYEWIVKKVEYLRYIAYNKGDRGDAYSHYQYAIGLEYLIGRSIKEGKPFPQHLLDAPKFGKQEYDMRPANLKAKPKR